MAFALTQVVFELTLPEQSRGRPLSLGARRGVTYGVSLCRPAAIAQGAQGRGGWVGRMGRAGAFAASLAVLGAAPGTARADAESILHALTESTDFRVRVNAALALGRSGSEAPDGTREALEQALGDAHPAVRVAAATALASLKDSAAIPALERRLAVESSASVAAQLRLSLTVLRRADDGDLEDPDTAPAPTQALTSDVHYVVTLGTMRNRTSVGGDEVRRVLSRASRLYAAALHGTVVVDHDGPLLRQAAARRIPVITLDGNVTRVTESRVAGGAQVQARVEFTVRRDQNLKGTLSGAATTFGPGAALTDESRRQLQDDAVSAAVQSALRGAEQGLLVAAR